MKEGTYITIQSWMRTDLGLSGNELTAYALVFGFSQDGESMFTGSMSYIAEWLGVSRQTAVTTMRRLVEKGLVQRVENVQNGVTFVRFRILEGVSKNLTGGCQKTLHNNNSEDKNRKEYIIPTRQEIEDFCREKGYKIDIDYFIAYYECEDGKWRDKNKEPVKDWRKRVVTWVHNGFSAKSEARKTEGRRKVAHEDAKDYEKGFDEQGNLIW